MRLPFLRSKDPAPERRPRAALADDAVVVEAARTRARRRLIGAGVLLLAGVIGFPMLFETQPRPLPVDTPIQVRPRDIALAPVPTPAAKPPALPAAPDAGVDAPDPVRPGEAGAEASAPADVSPSVPLATPAVPAPAEPKPVAALPVARPPPPDDGARARALLEGRTPAPTPAASRFVVQAGAYSDAATLRSARQRVERLGLKTYVQVVDTAAGKRTRVRVGPYASRDEADAAAARIKGAGLPAAVLML